MSDIDGHDGERQETPYSFSARTADNAPAERDMREPSGLVAYPAFAPLAPQAVQTAYPAFGLSAALTPQTAYPAFAPLAPQAVQTAYPAFGLSAAEAPQTGYPAFAPLAPQAVQTAYPAFGPSASQPPQTAYPALAALPHFKAGAEGAAQAAPTAYPTGVEADAGAGPAFAAADSAPSAPEPPKPLRVVHVGPCLLRGGAEQWLVDLLHYLDPQRVRFVKAIVTRGEQIDLELAKELPVPVEVGQAAAVRRAAEECDVMLSWGLQMDALLGDCRPKLSVFLAHGDGTWTTDLLEGSRKSVDHVVAVSLGVRENCCRGVPTSVIYNGVDSTRLSRTRSRRDARDALGFRPGDFVLGYVGRFSAEKRPHLVLEAVGRLPRRFKALMLGWGPQRQDLMELANARLPGRYAFATACSHLGDYYHAVDAVCLPSEMEGFPLVLLEAMMCRRPLVVTPVGCVPEVIQDRVNGLVVSGDAALIASAAALLHGHPSWARGLAAEGEAFAQRHGHAARMARDYENLLEKLWREKHAAG